MAAPANQNSQRYFSGHPFGRFHGANVHFPNQENYAERNKPPAKGGSLEKVLSLKGSFLTKGQRKSRVKSNYVLKHTVPCKLRPEIWKSRNCSYLNSIEKVTFLFKFFTCKILARPVSPSTYNNPWHIAGGQKIHSLSIFKYNICQTLFLWLWIQQWTK